MEERFGRYYPDMGAMHRGLRTEPCFVRKMVGGDILFAEKVIHRAGSV